MMTQSHRKIITGGDMRTPVIFYIAKPNDDFFSWRKILVKYIINVLLMFILLRRKIWT
ncbi:Uncharacterised protein [Staphylococcus gallinarum]|uniref:Uncharacterized protein n=1 Tax=Staphylococcus gallinarum TaxID=1293 RepID=A0A380FJF3_STAGA|nr:Uncharacterised protein [Staphylococcus gallinarum]